MSFEELERRAVACEGWRYKPGMILHMGDSARCLCWIDEEGERWSIVDDRSSWLRVIIDRRWMPDLRDHATLGCLEGLVREAYRGLVVLTHGPQWWCVLVDTPRGRQEWDDVNSRSYVEALVLALEFASRYKLLREDHPLKRDVVTYQTIKDVVGAKLRGEVPPDATWRVDNDSVALEVRQGNDDEDEDMTLYSIRETPWVVLEEVLKALGFEVEGV